MDYYNLKAKELFDKYQTADPEKIHASWSIHLPDTPGLALDVGGGSGRDAKWLAVKGWEVVVVEPAGELFKLGREYTEGESVIWIDDRLPNLNKLEEYLHRFSLILVSGVFMHLSPDERAASLSKLVGLMADKSLMVITLRQGSDSENRGFYQVEADEIVEFANRKGLQTEFFDNLSDELGRKEVAWQTIIVTKRGEG